jgi:hypothetical protein
MHISYVSARCQINHPVAYQHFCWFDKLQVKGLTLHNVAKPLKILLSKQSYRHFREVPAIFDNCEAFLRREGTFSNSGINKVAMVKNALLPMSL